jgi:hypothetical protein
MEDLLYQAGSKRGICYLIGLSYSKSRGMHPPCPTSPRDPLMEEEWEMRF